MSAVEPIPVVATSSVQPSAIRTDPDTRESLDLGLAAAAIGRRAKGGVVVQVEVHDRQQLELRFNYPVGEAGRWRYHVDTYFFVPRNVGLNRANYSREQFYLDFTALMRVDARPLPLDELADGTNPASPLYRFNASLEALRSRPRPPATASARVHVKLYAHLFNSGLRAECRRLEKRFARRHRSDSRSNSRASVPPRAPVGESAFDRDLDAALGRISLALTAWRKARAAWWPYERICHASLPEAMRAADEYMSLSVEERLAALSRSLVTTPSALDGTGTVQRVRLRLAEFARQECDYRTQYGYLTLRRSSLEPGVSRPRGRAVSPPGEYFTYRSSLLKKSVQQALYLDVRGSRADSFLRNAVSGVGAALAAIWALATQLPTHLADLPSQTKATFFAAAVLAYVMKDRIKALTSEFLLKRARAWDHTHWISGASLPDLGAPAFRARSSEAVSFVASKDIDDEVRAMRVQRRTVAQAEGQPEEVIHYRKRLEVGTPDGPSALPDGYKIRDILRVNVRHFLTRLDDPLDTVDWFDASAGRFERALLPKVYHVNVVVRVRREGASGLTEERWAHLRVVLDKHGIVRAEDVRAPGARGRRGGQG